jgi:hypothetical protein
MAAQGKAANSRLAGRTRWAKRIAQWAGSGQTQKAYCAKRGWALSTFQWWRARAKHAAAETTPVSFLPLTLAAAPKETAAVEVELSSKTRIRFEGTLAERATERLLARIR